MKLHCLQHVPYEALANIKVWAKNKGHSISKTLLFNNEELSQMNVFDWLIVLGDPMNIYEEKKYTWLSHEKKFTVEAISNQKIVLGIRIGVQLIADILGVKFHKNKYKEIGWFPVSLTQEAKESSIFNSLPHSFIAFHWHEDTFNIPPLAIRMVQSKACVNQALEYNKQVIRLQYNNVEKQIKGAKNAGYN